MSDVVFDARFTIGAETDVLGSGGGGGGGGFRLVEATKSGAEDTERCRGGGCSVTGFLGGKGGNLAGIGGVDGTDSDIEPRVLARWTNGFELTSGVVFGETTGEDDTTRPCRGELGADFATEGGIGAVSGKGWSGEPSLSGTTLERRLRDRGRGGGAGTTG